MNISFIDNLRLCGGSLQSGTSAIAHDSFAKYVGFVLHIGSLSHGGVSTLVGTESLLVQHAPRSR